MRLFSPKPTQPSTAPAAPSNHPISCDVGEGNIDFLALLREAVTTVNAAHQKAVDDLLTLAAQLDVAVADLSGGVLHIKLVEVADSPTEVAYEMQLHDPSCPHYSFFMYKVPISGYPIAFGQRGSGSKFGNFESQCANRLAIQKHFAELLTDPMSALVIQVSFAMRKAARCPWPPTALAA